MKPFFTPEPVIFFNSPASKKLPGNSIQAIEDAFLSGADVACINIQFSKDKVIMAISEVMIDNLCESSGAVSGFTCSELKGFDAGYRFTDDNGDFSFREKGIKFLTLEEILKSFPDKRFNITITDKDIELVKNYTVLVKKYNAENRVLTSTMYGQNIRLVRKLLPGSATSFTLSGIIGVYALFKSGLLYFTGGFKADSLQTPEAIGASYIANGALIEQLHGKGVKVHVWYVKDQAQLKRVYDAGADGFMVNDIDMVKSFLENKTMLNSEN
jgi:glycerophosphoryl diester phosphodiesterase